MEIFETRAVFIIAAILVFFLFHRMRSRRLEKPRPPAKGAGRTGHPHRNLHRTQPLYDFFLVKSVIVGTAGHIDHGKTALVKALTGIDADRLEEEKRRGITIDIGFAHLELPDSNGGILQLGFVDVPGHERFVRNMLAGVGGIDVVLLVIAADESIKPQTREHFDICRLLSVRRGITVLTKSDAVDPETLDVVRMEVEEFVRGSFLDVAHSPMVAVSALTGAGLDDLKQALIKVASEVSAKDSSAIARLPIDRVFSMKGFGTVVTGTLVSGTIHKEQQLEVFPTGQQVRVRGIQVHGQTIDQAVAGERTALNLTGVAMEDLARGMTLAPLSTFQSTSRVDVSLSLLASAKPLKDRARVHFHAHTMETIATVVLHGKKRVAPNEQAFAQLQLAQPALLLPGDRFILRQFSPVVTIGGGLVLDAVPVQKMPLAERLKFLEIQFEGDQKATLLGRIARRAEQGLTLSQAVAETGLRRDVVEAHAGQESRILSLGGLLIYAEAFGKVVEAIVETVSRFHKQNPLAAGVTAATLREGVRANPEVFDFALDSLLRSRKIEGGELVRLPGQGVVMKDEESESKKIIESAFSSAGLKVPALKDVLAGLKVDKIRAQKIVTLLLREKTLVKISEDLVFHRSALENLRKLLAAEKIRSSKIDVARFKELTDVSRKYAIPLLEYLDREHVTRRVGDAREIL
jgi:selenocysteine-specific elongation factor